MTLIETKKFLKILLELFPEFKITENTSKIWKEITDFAYYDDMVKALYEYAKKEKYTPKVAGILDYWRNRGYDTVPINERKK